MKEIAFYLNKMWRLLRDTKAMTSTEELLVISNVVTAVLFVVSEILGMSTCEYNGVIHFVFSGCSCLGKKKVYVDVEIRETDLL